MITSLQVYVLNISIGRVLKDIKLSEKNNIVLSGSYDKNSLSYDHQCGDTKDR